MELEGGKFAFQFFWGVEFVQLALGEFSRGIAIAAFGSVPIAPARLTPRCAHGPVALCALRVFL